MGCTASKLDNEDTVRRCKDRRRFMKDAVFARHHLAAAHSDYCRSLRLTGSALSSFAAQEPLSVSHQSPPILLNPTPSKSSNSNFNPPPPPPPISTPEKHPLHNHQPNHPKNVKHVKLPHILSESSFCSSPPKYDFTYKANANYSATPSQASSAWNWENFYPPSPPDSEYFQGLNRNNDDKDSVFSQQTKPHEQDKASVYSNSSFHKPQTINPNSEYFHDKDSIFSHQSKPRHPNPHEQDKASVYSNSSFRKPHNMNPKTQSHHSHFESGSDEDQETEREEVQCSEWDDHYSTTSSSDEGDRDMDMDSRSEMNPPSKFGSSVRNEPIVPPPYTNSKYSTTSKSEKFDDGASSGSWNGGNGEASDMKMVVRHRDLAEIVAAIKDYFDKAAGAGEQVSEMLETGRAQLDRSFSKLKKTVYHSSGMLSNLSSTWTSKPPLAVKYRYEPDSINEPGGSKSLCSTLERLLAWEKKLYQEVKAREGVKIEHERKLSALQSQEYKGDMEKLDKTKASITRLQSLILVTSQAVSTTSSAIIGLRDAELVPQLVELCHGFMYMWRSMNQFHEVQNQIVQQVRGLVNRSSKGESTSDLHRQVTRDLEAAVSSWHSSFCRLIKFQRDFIHSLHSWFKLTFIPVDSSPTNTNTDPSDVFAFCDEWKLAVDRIPDTVASEAIKSFINVVHSITLKQLEELKVKKRTESVSKELEKRSSSLRNIEKKYYQSYSMVGLGLPENSHVLDARDPLSEKKMELAACQRRVEDEMVRHSKAVEVTRAMTLNNIQTGLPGVFQAMTSFSALIMEALEVVCNRSYAIK